MPYGVNTVRLKVAIYKRRIARTVFSTLKQRGRKPAAGGAFDIKPGYHHADFVFHFNDSENKAEWQKEVYELAQEIARQTDGKTILDVGCGSGYKLVNILGNYDTTGIEVDPTYSWLCKQYPQKKWLLFDTVTASSLKADIVICSDVIEHIKNPDEMMEFLSKISFNSLLISTPERDSLFGEADFGPPANPFHFREWNAAEFKNYVARWFMVEEQRVFHTNTVTQVLICKKR